MTDSAMIRLALAIQDRNREQQQMQAQKEFLQRVSRGLAGKGQPVSYNYANVMFGEGVTRDQFVKHLTSAGETEDSAAMKANFAFKERTRMMYSPERIRAVYAEGQSLGLSSAQMKPLIESVAGTDSFIGEDDMQSTLLREVNSFQGWMRSGVNRTSEPVKLGDDKGNRFKDAQAGGPQALTSALLGELGVKPEAMRGGMLSHIGQMNPGTMDNVFLRNDFQYEATPDGARITANDGNQELASALQDFINSRATSRARGAAIGGAAGLQNTDSEVRDLVDYGLGTGASGSSSASGGESPDAPQAPALDGEFKARDLLPLERELLKTDGRVDQEQPMTSLEAALKAVQSSQEAPIHERALRYLQP